jgi:hypothetical protein
LEEIRGRLFLGESDWLGKFGSKAIWQEIAVMSQKSWRPNFK